MNKEELDIYARDIAQMTRDTFVLPNDTDFSDLIFEDSDVKKEMCVMFTDDVRKRCGKSTDEEHKFIIFYVNVDFPEANFCFTQEDYVDAVRKGQTFIETSCLNNISFGLLCSGYRIFLAYRWCCIELKPYMGGIVKELRYAHNVRKLVQAGMFNHLLGIPDYMFPVDYN